MNPLSLGLLAAATAVKAGGNVYAGSQMFNRDDRARLKELERKRALGNLGMTPGQEVRARRDTYQPLQAAEREMQTQTAQMLAGQDVNQGAMFRGMQASNDARIASRLAAQRLLADQQAQAVAMQEQEIRALQEAKKARRASMVQGGTQALAEGAKFTAMEYEKGKRQQQFNESQERIISAYNQSVEDAHDAAISKLYDDEADDIEFSFAAPNE